jgi:hypothetical protein
MLYHSNKLTDQEVKEILNEFFQAHHAMGAIETFSDGRRKTRVENSRFLLADLRKANRKLLAGGYELQLEAPGTSRYIHVCLAPLESQYETV